MRQLLVKGWTEPQPVQEICLILLPLNLLSFCLGTVSCQLLAELKFPPWEEVLEERKLERHWVIMSDHKFKMEVSAKVSEL